ncbi:hypothetical protein ABFX02_05G004000 [Erythranthe guttata]
MAVLLMVVVVSFVLILCFCCLSKWNQIRYRIKGLPPGNMGFPFFGETNDFLNHGPQFIKSQSARYGKVFKTHILGSPTIISMDEEMNRYILMNEGKGLIPGYPKSMLDILGNHNIAAVYGSTHKYMRQNILSLIGIPIIKLKLLPRIDYYIRIHLSDWDDATTINIQQKTMDMVFLMAFKLIFGDESDSIYDGFKSQFDKLVIGSLSLPINFPGTSYYHGFKGRRNVVKVLKEIIAKRRASTENNYEDMLDHFLVETKFALKDEEIIDQIVTILYSGYETESTTSMMAVKYLHDNQEALQELRDEHLAIRERKSDQEQTLDWDDYKSMRFTRAVILETLRLATITNGVLRKTTQDMKLNGFVIPQGWRIYVYTREINYDPLLYPEPLKFNPWRWLDNKNLESHNYFLIFGGGSRMCPGKELGIVAISIFLHYFVTKYSWEEVGGERIRYFPRVEAPDGYHIRVKKNL